MTPEYEAMLFINGAFRSINRGVSDAERAVLAVRIKDAMRNGETDVGKIAWRALEMEGWRPKWVDAGEVAYIGLETPEPTPNEEPRRS